MTARIYLENLTTGPEFVAQMTSGQGQQAFLCADQVVAS
jgi:hypothetical protein